MPTNSYLKDSPQKANRRAHSRQKLSSVAYIDLGPSNGGLVLNLSETGLALSAAMKLTGDGLSNMRFKLPGLEEVIEAQARIVWLSESKKEAGVQFEQLHERDARKINEWINAEQGSSMRLAEETVSHGLVTSSPEVVPHETLVESEKTGLEHPYQEFKMGVSIGSPASVGVEEQKTTFLGSQASLGTEFPGPLPQRKWGTSAAVIALIALVSFGIGVAIERRVRHEPPNSVGAEAAIAKANSDKTSAAPGLPDAKRASAESDSSVEQPGTDVKDLARNSAEPKIEPQPRVPTSVPQGSVSNADSAREEQGKKPSRRQETEQSANSSDISGRETSNRGDSSRKGDQPQSETAVTQSRSVPAAQGPDRKEVASRESGQKLPPTPSAEAASVQADNARVPTQKEVATAPGTSLVSAAEPAAPPPASAPPKAKALLPSVAISMPPFPSMRIPPELKSQASRAGTTLQMGQLVSRLEPTYPAEAVRQEISGTVKVHAAIGRDGAVQSVEANGPSLLAEAAMNAVRQWHYKPTLLDGQAIEADEQIIFVFRLSPANP